jgi:hypothetical protein
MGKAVVVEVTAGEQLIHQRQASGRAVAHRHGDGTVQFDDG